MDPIQQARYDRVFDGYVKGGEYLTSECFDNHVDALAEIRGLAPDDPSSAAFRVGLHGVWEALAPIADADNDGRISREEWRAAGTMVTAGLQEAKAAGGPVPFQEWVELLYRMIDADGDSRITQSEYADWLAALGLADGTDLDGAFAGFDKNEDGYLSLEEFSATYVDYWTEFDPNIPAHRWLGP